MQPTYLCRGAANLSFADLCESREYQAGLSSSALQFRIVFRAKLLVDLRLLTSKKIPKPVRSVKGPANRSFAFGGF